MFRLRFGFCFPLFFLCSGFKSKITWLYIREFFLLFSHFEYSYAYDDYDWHKIKHLCAWLMRVTVGLFLLDSDFIQNRMAFVEDQTFVGFFLCCIFFCMYLGVLFCMYLGVFYSHKSTELQKDIVQKQYG